MKKKIKQLISFCLVLLLSLQIVHYESHATEYPNKADSRFPRWNTYSNWMTDGWAELQNKRYCDMVLLGSHDTGTYHLRYFNPFQIEEGLSNTFNTLSKVPGVWDIAKDFTFVLTFNKSVTQDVNIYNQLMEGVRLLDLRLKRFKDDGQFRTFHGMFSDNADEVIAQIKDFIEKTSDKEIVFINFNQFGFQWDMTDEDKAELGKKFYDALGQYFFTPEEFSFTKTMGELAKTGKRIVMSSPGIYKESLHPTLTNYTIPQAQHSSQNIPGDVIPAINSQYNNAHRTTTDQKKLDQWYQMKLQVSWVSDEDLNPVLDRLKKVDIIGAIKLFEKNIEKSLRDHTKEAYPQIADYMLHTGEKDNENQPNIWSRDFYTKQEVAITIMRNFGKDKTKRDQATKKAMEDYNQDPFNASKSGVYKLLQNSRYDAGELDSTFANVLAQGNSQLFGTKVKSTSSPDVISAPLFAGIQKISLDTSNVLNALTFKVNGEDVTLGNPSKGAHHQELVLGSDEYVTKVEMNAISNLTGISYVAFTTNKGRVLRGGTPTNVKEVVEAPKGWMIFGAFGKASDRVEQLGFIYRPATVGSKLFFKEDGFGGSQGRFFDLNKWLVDNNPMKSITIHSVRRVDGLDVTFAGGQSLLMGVKTGAQTLTLHPDEYITEMTVHRGWNRGEQNIFYMELVTNQGRSISGGTKTDDVKTYKAPQGYMIGAFYGRFSEDLDRVGPVYQMIPGSYDQGHDVREDLPPNK